ncbi:MAG TPA: hypothetical protein PK867_15340, partial [Pirellulales bacterium]|nr:hypothetical protein [Pirellulales bacterium]
MYDLHEFLRIAGGKMGLYFTLEMATQTPASVPYAETLIGGKTRFASRDELIAGLSKQFHWFSFAVDETHPRVIHVIDKRLRGKERYSLERKADVEFAGTVHELCWKLHKQIDNLYPRRGGGLHEVGTDYYTETIVQSRNKTARQILTDAVPLDCYSSVLWRARMQGNGDDPTAEIDVTFGGLRDADFDCLRWWWWLNTARDRGTEGKRLRCYFTIETAYRAPDDPACCPVYFSDAEKFDSPDALVAELTKRVGWLTAVKDPNRAEIIHLIDKELLNARGYALDRRVEVDYQGTPDGLVKSLAERGTGVGPRVSL